MEIKLAKIENDIDTIFKCIKKQEDATLAITDLAKSIVELTAEIKYMRLDVTDNKSQIDAVKITLAQHEKSTIEERLMKYEVVENQIKSWILRGILALIIIGFITAIGVKLQGGI